MTGRRSVVAIVLVGATVAGPAGGSGAAELLTGADIANGTVTGADVKDASLKTSDFAAGVRGASGPTGAPGAAGAQGTAGATPSPGYVAVVPGGGGGFVPSGDVKSFVVSCPSGSTPIGGGAMHTSPDLRLRVSRQVAEDTWGLMLENIGSGTVTGVVPYAWCTT